MIDKAKKEAERAEPSSEVKTNVEKLQRYAVNFLNSQNINIAQSESELASDEVDQPEVESLLPNVGLFQIFWFKSSRINYNLEISIRTLLVTIWKWQCSLV